VANLLASAARNIPAFSQFLRLAGRALASGKTAELEELLAHANAQLALLLGGEGDGSPGR